MQIGQGTKFFQVKAQILYSFITNSIARKSYVQKMASLLVPGGKLVGVLFNCEFEGGPPFGGNKEEYLTFFQPFFKIKTFETCYNSIKPRSERELFIILEKL